jgi:hypothetical protein
MLSAPPVLIYDLLWLSFVVCLFPLFVCIAYGRVISFKRRYIVQMLQGNTFDAYKKAHAFQPSASPTQILESLFGPQYTVRSYVLPLIVDALVSAAGLVLFLVRVAPQHFGGQVAQIDRIPQPFFYGIAGGFLWGLYDLLRRFQEADLTPVCLCYVTMRIFIVGILSCILSVVFSEQMTPLIAFALGAFPVQTLWRFLKIQAKDKIKLSEEEGVPTKADLNVLPGMTKRTIEQLDRLSIENIEQLAYTNPVKLLAQTNLDWELILNMVDQAVLGSYIGAERIDILRPAGIRGATDLAALYDGITCNITEANTKSERLLGESALRLGLSRDYLESVLRNVVSCPQVRFIRCLKGDMNRWTQLTVMPQLEASAAA